MPGKKEARRSGQRGSLDRVRPNAGRQSRPRPGRDGEALCADGTRSAPAERNVRQRPGRTADPQRDMNDFLTLLVEKNRTYTLLYEDASGTACRRPVEVADSPVTVNLYMNR